MELVAFITEVIIVMLKTYFLCMLAALVILSSLIWLIGCIIYFIFYSLIKGKDNEED